MQQLKFSRYNNITFLIFDHTSLIAYITAFKREPLLFLSGSTVYNQNKHYALCIFNHREIIVTFRMNAAAQPSSPRSIYRPIHFADRSWTTKTAGSVYRRALNEGLRCDCDAAATSAAMQTRGAAVQRRPSRYQRVTAESRSRSAQPSGQMTQRLPGEVCPLNQGVDNRDCNTSPWCNHWQECFLSKAQSLFKLHLTTLRTNDNRNYFQIPVDVTLRLWAEPIFVLQRYIISKPRRVIVITGY